MLLERAGLVTRQQLKRGRRYAIVVAFVVAAVLTPPDVVSQLLLAIPLVVLYEVSLIAIWFTERRRARDGRTSRHEKRRRPEAAPFLEAQRPRSAVVVDVVGAVADGLDVLAGAADRVAGGGSTACSDSARIAKSFFIDASPEPLRPAGTRRSGMRAQCPPRRFGSAPVTKRAPQRGEAGRWRGAERS